jgi:DNA-binding LytR/AlgR family response regulator
VRISQSEILNLHKVKSFDFSAVGTIGVELENGESTWVARRRVRDVKRALAKGGNDGYKK